MRAPTNLHRGGVGFNMTPMIDIVFLLIIFFLVSSHLARQEVQLELDLPVAESGRRLEAERVRRLIVNVQEEGRVQLGGREIDAPTFGRVLREERQESEDLEVRIRSDRQVPYSVVEPLMVEAARAGVWNVTFAVVRNDRQKN